MGSVSSTERIISGLIRNNLAPIGILGYDYTKAQKRKPSGYCDLSIIANKYSIDFMSFSDVNSKEVLGWVKTLDLEVIFAVGFSQLLSETWFSLAKMGCVGFHPTKLPRGRGRAPLAWLVLNEAEGAANFFQMTAKADEGNIYVQEPFDITITDSAESVEFKILKSIDIALDRWLPRLKNGDWTNWSQDGSKASYYGLRKPKDGYVNWSTSHLGIYKLIKATSSPHPNAFSFCQSERIDIVDSKFYQGVDFKGVVGRVLDTAIGNWLLVQCEDRPLWIRFRSDVVREIRVGTDLGINLVEEILSLKSELNELKRKV